MHAPRIMPPAVSRRIAAAAVTFAVAATFAPASTGAVGAATSFQTLVNNASPGSTITVPPGVYNEIVRITKPLTINATGVIIDGGNTRDLGLAVVNTQDVTVTGLTVRNVKSDTHEGAVWTTGSSRFTFKNGVAKDSSTICISLNGGSGHKVLDSQFFGCEKEGYFTNEVTDTLFRGNHIHHNNTALSWDSGVEAGGGKISNSDRVTFDGNEIDHNGGPGLWFDNGADDAVAIGNRVHHNHKSGIFVEISKGADIADNAVWENGWGNTNGWAWGAGILISSSDGAEVHGNTVAWNNRGISVVSQARDLSPHDHNVVHDNIVVSEGAKFVAGFYDDHGGSLFSSANANRGYGGRYWISAAEPTSGRFEWNGPKQRLSEYEATPAEDGSRYLTTAERDLALASAGISGPGTFTDIGLSSFAADIEWLVAQGITSGCSATRFCPKDPVTRGQMASFLVRMFDLPAGTKDYFTDDETSIHEPDINRVAAAGITSGCASNKYCPKSTVTRAQMASFIVRAAELTTGAGRDYFYDDNTSIHEPNIDRAAAAGIASGCATWRFCPGTKVTREQMAGFLHRVENPVPPPDYPAPPPPS